ncbi:MAG: hypothetical protein DRN57_04030 [Thermoplasmata archaeon]|nr:MAG: hypothetical protein DRN57_04030 [Thermoplasmata archaeon]
MLKAMFINHLSLGHMVGGGRGSFRFTCHHTKGPWVSLVHHSSFPEAGERKKENPPTGVDQGNTELSGGPKRYDASFHSPPYSRARGLAWYTTPASPKLENEKR